MKHYIASGSYRDFDPDVWLACETRGQAADVLREYYGLTDAEFVRLQSLGHIRIALAPDDLYDLSIIPCNCNYPEMHNLEVARD